MGNSSGSYRAKPENSLAAYDKLPAEARKALQDAAFNWAPQPIRTRMHRRLKGYRDGKEIARSVKKWDRDHMAKERKRVWGPDYPAP